MRSPASAGWHELSRWNSFETEVRQFFASLSGPERDESVGSSYITGRGELIEELPEPTNEDGFKDPLLRLYGHPHNAAIRTRLLGVAPHSKILVWAASHYSFIGQPYLVFQDTLNGFNMGVMELKTFWFVTKEDIDNVLNGTCPHLDLSDWGRNRIRNQYGP
jgi:hypothetical protein